MSGCDVSKKLYKIVESKGVVKVKALISEIKNTTNQNKNTSPRN